MHSQRGFTLLELLIVIGISALFSSLVIVYGRSGQNAVALTVQEAEISQLILKAKGLSITTYTGVGLGCGDGVHFDLSTGDYSLFVYSPNGNVCPSLASISQSSDFQANGALQPYSSQSWQQPLTQGLVMQTSSANTLSDVLFYPPDPETLISRNGKTFLDPTQISNITSKIYLETVDGKASGVISVSPTGQVSIQ